MSIDLTPGGILASGYNGSGKSSFIQSIFWMLGAMIPAEQILNSTTLAPASVEMVLSVDGEDIKLSRVLVPQKNEAGKVVATSSNYSVNDRPEKATRQKHFIYFSLRKNFTPLKENIHALWTLYPHVQPTPIVYIHYQKKY